MSPSPPQPSLPSLAPADILGHNPSALDLVTVGYGVGSFYHLRGQQAKAEAVLRAIVNTSYWAGFGYIAAEADLFRWSSK
jgi:hypothetical protein